MDKRYKSEVLGSLHETASGLHKIGLISDQEMCEYDRDCLVSETTPAYEDSAAQKQTVPVFAASGSN